MIGTRKPRVSMVEQIRLINECRQSGMTDVDWCRENDIEVKDGQTPMWSTLGDLIFNWLLWLLEFPAFYLNLNIPMMNMRI